MILQQYYLGCLSQASYLVGDPATGEGAVIDPRRDVDEYLQEARGLGLRIKHILLTHLHADFLAGHLELARATGADIYLGAKAKTDYPMVPMRDGESLSLGGVRLQFLETPGHTPESVCIVVYQDAKTQTPHAVLTGDTLFIGSVGRPDLLVSVGYTAEDLAGQLFDSIHSKLMTLPKDTLVYPGHGAGSACGKGISSETVSTIGAQQATNLMVRIGSKDAFIQELTQEQPAQPQYFAFDASQNRKTRPILDDLLRDLKPLGLEEVLWAQQEGTILLDVRDGDAFSSGYIRGSLGIGLDGQFASWAGTVIEPTTRIILVATPGQEQEATIRLARIGYDNVAGYLEGGIEAAAQHGDILTSFDRMSPDALDAVMKSGASQVIDIRSAAEWAAAHIANTPNIPLETLETRLAEISKDKPVVIVCQSGYRSILATSLIAKNGFSNVTDLRGGFVAWSSRAATP